MNVQVKIWRSLSMDQRLILLQAEAFMQWMRRQTKKTA